MKRARYILGMVFFLAASSLYAAAPAPDMASKYKSDKPVEINADNLEVQQEKNLAIFSGNVVAVQGDMRLKSDRMTVHYRKSDERGGGDAPKDAISSIEVDGHVLLATPEETASGEQGI